ncbi:cell division protein MukB [Bacillus cereus]|nr:cell division protein MukB [Bacillus cereus]PFS33882.1 cell division protein MukB [Bacillus cereus]
MVISILGGLASLILTGGLLISLFVKRLKPSRKKLTIALVTSVILCVVGGALYEISPEDKAKIAQEAEAKKVAKAKAKEEKEKAQKEEEAKAQAEKEAKEQKKKEEKKLADEKKAREEVQKKEEEAKRKAEKEEADRIKAEEKAQKEAEKAEREAQKKAEEEKKKTEAEAKKRAEEEEAKRLKAEKEEKEKAEKEQKAQAKKEKEEREKKKGTKVEIVNYDTCTSQNRFCDRGGFHDGAFDALRVGMNPEEVTLKLDRNAKGASIEYIKDKSGNYVEVIQYHFESAWYFVDASFKDGKLYYAERNEIKASKDKKEERRILDGRE